MTSEASLVSLNRTPLAQSPRIIDGIVVFFHRHGTTGSLDSIQEEWCCGIKRVVSDIWHDRGSQRNQLLLLYRNPEMQIMICIVTDTEEEVIVSNLRKCTVGSFEVTWRLYSRLPTVVDTIQESPDTPHLLVSVGMSPSAGLDEDFNNWYTEEHIPLLSRVPGWLYSRRYILKASSADDSGLPPTKYLAAHGWTSRQSFDTKPYKEAVSTPWRTRVVVNGGVTQHERYDLDFIKSVD